MAVRSTKGADAVFEIMHDFESMPSYAQVLRRVRTLPESTVRTIAADHVFDMLADRERMRTLRAERQATSTGNEQYRTYSERRGEWPHGTRMPRKGTKARERWEQETEEGRAWVEMERDFEHKKYEGLACLLDEWKDHLRIEWTAELLESEISMPDGRRTTWGAASLDDHRKRKAMFESNAVANLEGAARHAKAIEDLESTGASCLNDVVRAA